MKGSETSGLAGTAAVFYAQQLLEHASRNPPSAAASTGMGMHTIGVFCGMNVLEHPDHYFEPHRPVLVHRRGTPWLTLMPDRRDNRAVYVSDMGRAPARATRPRNCRERRTFDRIQPDAAAANRSNPRRR
jgi:nitrous oxide reductase accessory protein NosL